MTATRQSGRSRAPTSTRLRCRRPRSTSSGGGRVNKLKGWLAAFVTLAAVVMSGYHLYTAYEIVPAQTLRAVHLAFVLFLCFLVFPVARRHRHRVMWWDWIAALLAIAVTFYLLQGGDDLTDRNTSPLPWDIFFGIALMALVLEAMRRTSGWIMPVILPRLPRLRACRSLAARALDPQGLRGGPPGRRDVHDAEGIFGVALDVSSSLIILFTIFGAFLQYSGAGKFYLDFSFSAMGGKPTGAGRTVVLASFLLGGPSGSGVATTVTLGRSPIPCCRRSATRRTPPAVCWRPAACAIISPPVLGARPS